MRRRVRPRASDAFMTTPILSVPSSAKAGARSAMILRPIVVTLGRVIAPNTALLLAQTAIGVVETNYTSRPRTNALLGVSVFRLCARSECL